MPPTRSTRIQATLGAALLLAARPMTATAAPGCPDVSGRYQLVDPGPALADARQALGLGNQATIAQGGQHVLLQSADGGRMLRVHALAPDEQPSPAPAPRTLSLGIDFECTDGWIDFRTAVPSSRQGERQALHGKARVRMRGAGNDGLHFAITFSGGASANLYSYDSARIDVPVPLSNRTLKDTAMWPAAQAQRRPDAQEVAQRQAEDGLRARLAALLSPARLAYVKAEPGGALAKVTTSRSDELIALEDRLRSAGVDYEFESEPQWYGNVWNAEIRVPDRRGAAPAAARPSAFRIAAELNRLLPPLAHAERVRRVGATYLAEITLLGGAQAERLIGGLAARSTLIGEVAAMPAEPPRGDPAQRRVVWLVTLRR